MSRRTLAGIIAVPLLIALWLAAVLMPLPYVTYAPGITVDVLAEDKGTERIQIEGHRSYPTADGAGELRMTTIYVTPPRPEGNVNLFKAVGAWVDDEKAIYPYDSVYQKGETQEDSKLESAVQMVSSQDAAIAAALTEIGVDVKPVIEILNVTTDMPADGKLEVRDEIQSINGVQITSADDVVKQIDTMKAGEPVRFVVRRNGKVTNVNVTPKKVDGELRVGIVQGPGYDFPFDVKINISPDIGGPSAGLMFSLGIYDSLTPGPLTGGGVVAGTGTINEKGEVGSIGGIQQKIVGGRESGAELFLVPAGNCEDALGAPNGDMRLVKATTMHDAMESVKAWAKDKDATLPSCETKKG